LGIIKLFRISSGSLQQAFSVNVSALLGSITSLKCGTNQASGWDFLIKFKEILIELDLLPLHAEMPDSDFPNRQFC